jgi:NAD-dependent dihydropyrimidine dehydrogenase PreA subunit
MNEVLLMCQFCTKHGAGKRWYLNERNLSIKLAKELGYEPWELDHWKIVDRFYGDATKMLADIRDDPKMLEQSKRMYEQMLHKDTDPRKFPEGHMGQVITLEESKKICEIAGDVYRCMCLCRRMNRNEKVNTCMPLGLHGEALEGYVDWAPNGVEKLSIEEGKAFLDECDEKGLIHTVASTPIPIAFAMCNCQYPECIAMRPRLDLDVKTLLKGHFVASLDLDKCSGCGSCASRCQFGAATMRPTAGKANINQFKCFGCGICRAACPEKAITLIPRENIPHLKEEW